jgi:osmotically-inducible protein OsmY
MRTDADIQKDVMDQLKWEPFLNAEQIGVAVKNGIVTLSGIVDSFSKKFGAELAARKVVGVRVVAEEIQVGSSPLLDRTDTEIAGGILNVLKWHTAVPEELLKIKVEKGVVSLEGEVKWNFQREAAVNAVKNLAGVRSVNNFITIRSVATPADVRDKISASLARHAVIDAEKIKVELSGNRVILSGTVRSLAERDDAEHAAWSAPGVGSVENLLTVAVQEGDRLATSILQ